MNYMSLLVQGVCFAVCNRQLRCRLRHSNGWLLRGPRLDRRGRKENHAFGKRRFRLQNEFVKLILINGLRFCAFASCASGCELFGVFGAVKASTHALESTWMLWMALYVGNSIDGLQN